MNEATRDLPKSEHQTFESLFYGNAAASNIRIPDYQRAYSWEKKQIDLFINDLIDYHKTDSGYYFGHFIAENVASENSLIEWEIVDGQQRITTFILFLMVCQSYYPTCNNSNAYSLIERFKTVSYDLQKFETICANLRKILSEDFNSRVPSEHEFISSLELIDVTSLTRSLTRMALALLHFHEAFQKRFLMKEQIDAYISVIMRAHCSLHLAKDKSVAVNIFEMHNTRGVPLTTLEIIKAMLMKFVYDYDATKVKEIQNEFGEIYGLEEQLAAKTFRGEMTMEQLLRLHLRVVDDGDKRTAHELHSPAMNADSETILEYVKSRLLYKDGDKTKPKISAEEGVKYAINLAKEFKKSVFIISNTLPIWDEMNPLVGDVLILEREISCEFFLIVCRSHSEADNVLKSLPLWEKLLFTRDFHNAYHGKSHRDNFPLLFEELLSPKDELNNVIQKYLADGFRPNDVTKDLQSIVFNFLSENKESILNRAFNWWKHKMIYAIYKYETNSNAEIRNVMKGNISVEHILPQQWKWKWINGVEDDATEPTQDEKNEWVKKIDVESFINGLGNLLLLSRSANASLGNQHPCEKDFRRFHIGGSYEFNQDKIDAWKDANNWPNLINDRGQQIYNYMMKYFFEKKGD